jgi:hypothetical protein
MKLKILNTWLSLWTAVVVCGSAQASPVNVVKNPGFEDTTLTFWSTSTPANFGFILENSAPHSGVNSVRNNACAFGCESAISQSLVTSLGGSYNLSFFARTSNSNNASPEVRVRWGGQSVFDQNIAAGGPWMEYTIPGLVASGPATSLEFTVAAAGVLHLDDVDAALPVPEPSTSLLLTMGVLGLAAYRRRRA